MPATRSLSRWGAPLGAPLSLPGFLRRRWLTPSEAGLKASHFRRPVYAAWLVAPQLLILLFFFFIPSGKALSLAFVQVDPFGGTTMFVGLDNFTDLLASAAYRDSAVMTFWFVLGQSAATLLLAGLLAFATDHVLRGRFVYKNVILLPYAVAPAISGVIWAFLFNTAVGPVSGFLHGLGLPWDPNLRTQDALILVTVATVWKHICYDYIFMVAALLAVPQSLREAAAIDGAGPVRRFLTISIPLMMPTIFFLIVMNFVYGMFETFAIIDAITRGGPAGATTTLVYKVYQDGFVQLNLGASAAESVILMVISIAFTVLQFRAVENKVSYQV